MEQYNQKQLYRFGGGKGLQRILRQGRETSSQQFDVPVVSVSGTGRLQFCTRVTVCDGLLSKTQTSSGFIFQWSCFVRFGSVAFCLAFRQALPRGARENPSIVCMF